MISVVVYGRNDDYGYNAHRRVALCLNCLAEVLVDPGDEILFTDYNTPDALPTLPEALSDTLTSRCRALIRVLRVPAAVHEARHRGSPLPVVESLARNVAIRRTNPGNRWVLLTNPDLVVIPKAGDALGEACAGLPDLLYTIPRFELPEWLWEDLPRSDPAQVRSVLERLGPALRLDEPTVSHDWLRFDAAGDFQLVPRNDLFAIDGLDERMTLGWHVDANLGQRMLMHRGSIGSLAENVAGYHCNHHRTTTALQERASVNDLERFVLRVGAADIPSQRDTWGLAESPVQEIRLDPGRASILVDAVLDAVSTSPSPPAETDARDEKWRLEYHSGHTLPFVADALHVSPASSRVAYLGANETLRRMLAVVLRRLDWPELILVDHDSQGIGETDVLVVDRGIDSQTFDAPLAGATGAAAIETRRTLRATFEQFGRVVENERASVLRGAPRRRFVLVNSSAVYWNAFTLAQLDVGPTTPHSSVRSATVRLAADDSQSTWSALRRAGQLWSWVTRLDGEDRPLRLRTGRRVELAGLDDYAGFGSGWGHPDRGGLRASNPLAELAVALDERTTADAELQLVFDGVTDGGASPAAAVGGEALASDTASGDSGTTVWTIRIPPRHLAGHTVHLELGLPPEYRLLALRARRPGRGQLARSLDQLRRGRTTPRH